MKQLLFALTVLVSLSLASCGDKAGNPKTIASDYLNAVNKLDFEKAKKFATSDTKQFVDMLSTFAAMVPDSMKKKMANAKITIDGEPAITGDDATVSFTNSDKPGAQTLKLKKVEGKWMVQQTKQDGGAGMEMPAASADEAMAADTAKKPAAPAKK